MITSIDLIKSITQYIRSLRLSFTKSAYGYQAAEWNGVVVIDDDGCAIAVVPRIEILRGLDFVSKFVCDEINDWYRTRCIWHGHIKVVL